jgi:hypothetical protein
MPADLKPESPKTIGSPPASTPKLVRTKRAPTHTVVYGPQGTGKSQFAQSYALAYLRGEVAGPLLVLLFDPRGKDAPYLCQRPDDAAFYGCKHEDMEWRDGVMDVGGYKVPFTEVYVKGVMACRVEYFHEENLVFEEGGDASYTTQPIKGWTVLPKLRKRLNILFRDEQDKWGAVTWDSVTSAELMIRSYHQYVQNPGAKGEAQKKWWGASTDELEKILAVRFSGWRGNFIVLCHVDKDRNSDEAGSVLRYYPRLPGRLSNDIGSYFPEVYHSFAATDGEGEVNYLLQTRPNDKFAAFSAFLKVDNPCENTFFALWTGWK